MLPYDGTPRFMRSATVGSLAFPQLTSLEIRHFCLELADFLSIFAAKLSICRGYKFGALDAGSFKESLVSLTLKCQIEPEELDVVLGGYPNLKKLYLHSAVSQPISSTPSLVNMPLAANN
ncbi:hypothetical protein IWW39_002551 [Coemansia spiralis]|uniref:Uncharacterized protein n=1 Tax=Coemansia spiralis TaxID=417178 RepID=A0A9W8GKN7_9FUNG|nr:hypothetical protein IWW39_002551 [Coemansia spiralis]